ncbi:unnamed protein product, partial [Prorocentrum cordatum]
HRYSPFLVKGSPAPAAPPRPADPDPPPLFPCPLPRSRPTCAVSPPGPPEDAPGPRVGLRALAAPTGGGRGGQRGARAAEASGLRGGARHGGRVREAEPARIPRHALHSEGDQPDQRAVLPDGGGARVRREHAADVRPDLEGGVQAGHAVVGGASCTCCAMDCTLDGPDSPIWSCQKRPRPPGIEGVAIISPAKGAGRDEMRRK